MFNIHDRLFRRIALMTALVFGLTHMPIGAAMAALVGTDQIVSASQLQDARTTIQAFMAREDVRVEFQRQGVDPMEAEERIASLSDEEAVKLANTIKTAPAGGVVGEIIGAAVLIFIILLITDLLGYTNVFPFTSKGSARP